MENITDQPVHEIHRTDTVVVCICDRSYFYRAERTIMDLRTVGNWKCAIVLITINFDLTEEFKIKYDIIEKKFEIINTTNILKQIGPNGFTDTIDKREITKIYQWEKFHVFDDYFKQWNRVFFVDAGLRILDDIKYILELDYKNKIIAPYDGKINDHLVFKTQVSNDNLDILNLLMSEYDNILESNFMLNCIWVYDTAILDICCKKDLIDAMNKYILCKTNEMTIMNILFHFKHKLWEPFPIYASNKKILFDWCESNNINTHWSDYCFLKYPIGKTFAD
jgi:hypothetical protein